MDDRFLSFMFAIQNLIPVDTFMKNFCDRDTVPVFVKYLIRSIKDPVNLDEENLCTLLI